MTEAAVEARQRRPKAPAPRVVLRRDDSGSWNLAAPDSPGRRFPDFDAALDGTRHVPGSQTAMIEVWQSGEYICCLTPEEWPPRRASIGAAPIAADRSAFIALERYANRAAEVLMAVAGPFFWLALVVVAVAASLGWRLLLL